MNKHNTFFILLLLLNVLVVSCSNTPERELPSVQTPAESQTPTEPIVSESSASGLSFDPEGRNAFSIRNVPPEGLPEHWDSMQFAIKGEIKDWIGKPLSQLGEEYIFVTPEEVKIVPPGVRMDVGLTTKEYQELSNGLFNLMELRVFNPFRDRDLAIEEALVVSVFTDSSPLMIFTEDFSTFGENSTIFPKGLTIFDTVERMKELYGEPDIVIEDFDAQYAYISGDKSLVIRAYEGIIDSFLLQSFEDPDYVVEAHQGDKAYSEEVSEEAFFNIGGYHLHFLTPFAEVKEALQLVNISSDPEKRETQDQATLAPGEDDTYVAVSKGFDNLAIALRVHNLTEETIRIQDAVVTGMRVTLLRKNYSIMEDLMFRIPESLYPSLEAYAEYTLPVIAPLGISLSDGVEESLKKIPENALENVLREDGGGYATYDAHEVRFLVMGRPHEKGNVIDEMTLIMFLDEEP